MIFSKIRIHLIKVVIDFNEKLFFERKLKAFYKRTGIVKAVIDVGANKGQTIDFFLALNPACNIYAIEANPTLFSKLISRYAKFPNVKIFNIGISDTSGEKLFFENVLDYTSSFEELNMDSSYLQHKANVLGVEKTSIVAKKYLVSTRTLSELLNEIKPAGDIDVLKIDTEGHEYYCLLGLFKARVEANIKYIQLENHNDDMYSNRIQFNTINDLLNTNNFYECAKIKHGIGDFDEIIYSNANIKSSAIVNT